MRGRHTQSIGQCGALGHSARRCPIRRVVIVLAVLGLVTQAQAANDFTGDPNLVMQYRFESGALTTDTWAANTLTNSGGGETATCMEGACAVDLEDSEDDYLYIADAGLPANFPYKDGTTSNKSFSVCFWFRPESVGDGYIISKFEAANYSWTISMGGNNDLRLVLGLNSTSGATVATFAHASGVTLNQWYHVAMTYNDPNRAVRLRIWDETASAILGTDRTGTMHSLGVWHGDSAFTIGRYDGNSQYDADGIVDELLIWNCWLRTDEIDDIRDGSYVYSDHGQAPPPPPPPGGYLFYLDNSASGANDGTSWADAWETWADAAAGLAAQPDKGGGCTLIVSEGTGVSYGVIERASVLRENRADWLVIQAAEGEHPLFTQIICGSSSMADIRTIKLILDGLTVCGQDDTWGAMSFLWVQSLELLNLDVSTPGITIAGGKYNPQYSMGASFSVRNAKIQGCKFHHGRRLCTVDNYGGWYPDEVNIVDCEFYDMADDGLNLGGTNLDIWRCHFYDPNYLHTYQDLVGTVQDGPFIVGEIIQQDTSGAQGVFRATSGYRTYVWPYNEIKFVSRPYPYTVRGLTSGAYIESVDPDYVHQDLLALDTGAVTSDLDFRDNLFDMTGQGGNTWCQGVKINAKTFGSQIDDVNFVNNLIIGKGSHGFLVNGINGLRMWNNLFQMHIYFATSYGSVTTVSEMYNNVFLAPSHGSTTANKWEADIWKAGNYAYIECLAHGNNYWNSTPTPGTGPSDPYVLAASERASCDFSTAYFTDFTNRDYTLIHGSPLIDAGYAVGAPTTDKQGNVRDASPDIGPYERLTPPAPAVKPWRYHLWGGHMP